MADRITQKNLEGLCDALKTLTGSPMTPYVKDDDGKYIRQPGNFHISYAYGGVELHRMDNQHGGVETISTGGYGTKRELYNWMGAFLAGMAI